jgi:hypothetical protein
MEATASAFIKASTKSSIFKCFEEHLSNVMPQGMLQQCVELGNSIKYPDLNLSLLISAAVQ